MKLLKKLHFYLGILLILVFILTGQYMHHFHSHLENMSDGPRMLYRSAHIYIFLSSLLNIMFGVYLIKFNQHHKIIIQYITSIIILISPFLLLIGFFLEPQLLDLERPYSRIGIYSLLIAAMLLIYLGFSGDKK